MAVPEVAGRPPWRPIRQRLRENPRLKNLCALSLDDGSETFLPAVGPAGVEDFHAGRPNLRVPTLPVVKTIGGRELAYLPWRNGDTAEPARDGRWDCHLGEMVLDDETLPGPRAGDLRFVQFQQHGGWVHVTDEACPLTMAGDTLFYAGVSLLVPVPGTAAVIAGVSEAGAWRSDDLGKSWHKLGADDTEPIGHRPHQIVFDPAEPQQRRCCGWCGKPAGKCAGAGCHDMRSDCPIMEWS